MTTRYITLNVADAVGIVRITRPEKRNALSPEVLSEIETVFTEIPGREDIRVVIFTGGEKLFSAGFDLDFLQTVEKDGNAEFISLFHRAYKAILYCPQPVIAAVGGPAIAGGFDLTMMCDIRYASERAKFGQREIALALTPVLDPLWRIIGLGRALEVALSGRIYDAAEAEQMGYVSRVFPAGKLLESVLPLARTMATYDRLCLRETKQLGQRLLNQDLESAMKTQEWLFRDYLGAPENRKRVKELLEQLKKK